MAFWAKSRGRPHAGVVRSPPRDEIWPYSEQHKWIASEGHRFPPPSFGAPTLVWHFGIWKRQIAEAEQRRLDADTYHSLSSFEEHRAADVENFDKNNIAFFDEVSNFLKALQLRGRLDGEEPAVLKYRTPEIRNYDGAKEPYRFKVCDPQSLSFTIWWSDGDAPAVRRNAPSPGDLRVRVQAQTHLDHATVSFYIDIGKPRHGPAVYSSSEAVGERRKALLERVELIRAVCDRQVELGAVDLERLPEFGVSDAEAQQLKEAAEYFYVRVWREFISAFAPQTGVAGTSVLGPDSIGEMFADYRGAVLSVEGLSTAWSREREGVGARLRAENRLAAATTTSDATTGFGRFRVFDNDEGGEPNTVLKAYWPFIRRMAPDADERDHVACGILDWRALFVSAQGSAVGDDAEVEAPHLPQGWFPEADTPADRDRPVRYLLLTKGEPHRQQIGRFVERINALGTMRLFAFKDLEAIRNASVHIRILGHELDGILADWSKRRLSISERWDKELHALETAWSLRRLRNLPFFKRYLGEDPKLLRINDKRANELNNLIGVTDARLISLGAALDTIGQGGSGRLLYIINRSKHFVGEFDRMAKTLEVGNVDGWINYLQFVERGLKPTFDLIDSTATRLVGLRERLQSITQMIQTSALIVESVATQSNTAALRNVASRWGILTTLLLVVSVLLINTVKVAGDLTTWGLVTKMAQEIWTWVSRLVT